MKGPRDWGKLLVEQEASGLSIREFCKRRGISPSGLYHYTSQQGGAKEAAPKFIEAVVSDRVSLIELHGPRWSVKVPSNLPSSELTRIVRAVTEAL